MGKIVVYGVGNVVIRRNVECFLDTAYEIVGYSDTYFGEDILDHKPFFRPEELHKMDFDYILLCSFQESLKNAMRGKLEAEGVPADKIVDLKLLVDDYPVGDTSFDLIGDIEEHYNGEQGLIFGLSYSMLGIHENALSVPFYSCASPGLDLYYNFRIFTYMREEGLLNAVKSALLVFPYYYFDYDMSRSLAQYRNWRMCGLRRLNDWHHYRCVPKGADFVANYRLFGKKFAQFYHSSRFVPKSMKTYQGEKGKLSITDKNFADKRFFQEYEETARENKEWMSQFFRALIEEGIEPVLIVPPIYIEGLEESAKIVLSEKKRRFERILGEIREEVPNMRFYDYADIFAGRREWFSDITHVNFTGGEHLTERINRDILL